MVLISMPLLQILIFLSFLLDYIWQQWENKLFQNRLENNLVMDVF